jgi:hypothetical protein
VTTASFSIQFTKEMQKHIVMESPPQQLIGFWLPLLSLLLMISCKNNDKLQENQNQTTNHTSEVVLQWLDYKYRMMIQNATNQQLRKPGFTDQLCISRSFETSCIDVCLCLKRIEYKN